MKNFLFALFLGIGLSSCNGPEQNTTVGNSEDSTTVRGTDTASGAGLENSGGNPGPVVTDTAKEREDSLAQVAKKKKALRK